VEPTLTFFELAERIYGIGEILKRQIDFGLFRKHLHSFTGHVVIGRVISPILNVVRHHFSVWSTRIEYFKTNFKCELSRSSRKQAVEWGCVYAYSVYIDNSQNTTTEVYHVTFGRGKDTFQNRVRRL